MIAKQAAKATVKIIRELFRISLISVEHLINPSIALVIHYKSNKGGLFLFNFFYSFTGSTSYELFGGR